jgi:tRNA (cytosine38-C5)-methyltransferase
VENVKGFESSEARNLLVAALHQKQFVTQEFLLNPMQFGIPNSRLRYYLLGKRAPLKFCFKSQSELVSIYLATFPFVTFFEKLVCVMENLNFSL